MWMPSLRCPWNIDGGDMEIRRIMGRKGRITIPFAMRTLMRLHKNDVLSFYLPDDNHNIVVISKERVCDSCRSLKEGDVIWRVKNS